MGEERTQESNFITSLMLTEKEAMIKKRKSIAGFWCLSRRYELFTSANRRHQEHVVLITLSKYEYDWLR